MPISLGVLKSQSHTLKIGSWAVTVKPAWKRRKKTARLTWSATLSKCSATKVLLESRGPELPEERGREGGAGQKSSLLEGGLKKVSGREQEARELAWAVQQL